MPPLEEQAGEILLELAEQRRQAVVAPNAGLLLEVSPVKLREVYHLALLALAVAQVHLRALAVAQVHLFALAVVQVSLLALFDSDWHC